MSVPAPRATASAAVRSLLMGLDRLQKGPRLLPHLSATDLHMHARVCVCVCYTPDHETSRGVFVVTRTGHKLSLQWPLAGPVGPSVWALMLGRGGGGSEHRMSLQRHNHKLPHTRTHAHTLA